MARPALILLSGQPGVGKSSACLRLVQELRRHGRTAGGIVTLARGRERYALDVACGEERLLAAEGEMQAGPRCGRFHFLRETLGWGNRVVAQAIADRVDLVVLDEVGPLELDQADGFRPALRALLAGTGAQLVVVRPALVAAVRALAAPRATTLWQVTSQNRDSLPTEIAAWLLAGILP